MKVIVANIEADTKTLLVGQVSHELKTQINGIFTYQRGIEESIIDEDFEKISFYSNKIKNVN